MYEDAARIPGVTVTDSYTDSLGRTKTALHIGMWTMVVNTSNGQVLAMLQSAGSPVTVCSEGKPNDCYQEPGPGASTNVYISEGWALAASVPKTS